MAKSGKKAMPAKANPPVPGKKGAKKASKKSGKKGQGY